MLGAAAMRTKLVLLTFAAGCSAAPIPSAERPAPTSPVATRSITSAPRLRTCFLLREVGGSRTVETGDDCDERHAPASTFKVPHALIALETGARTGPDDFERWDGTNYPFRLWNRNQTLSSAMQASVVWYFQRTAERIGQERMREWLERLAYGNREIGANLVRFWLDGPLAISAREQATFWDRFVRRDLPVNVAHVELVDRLILQKPGEILRAMPTPVDVTWDPATTRVHAKTGSTHAGVEVRWLVGHVDTDAARYVFVSLVTSPDELSNEAIVQAMHGLRDAGLVKPKPSGAAE
jgi:beta-lactamase class D